MLEKGTLYICATPIGNLGDITLRVLDTLREADLIAAEDTRHSRKLLEHYQIKTPLTSYHEHNEKGKSRELMNRLKSGETIALISDAGMPGISDPGAELIYLCQEEGLKIDVLPGPNAAITALILSGLPADNFAFRGFLPATGSERKRKLSEYSQLMATQIFYEAPHRLIATLRDMEEAFGVRQAVVVRELTKLHQQAHRGFLKDLLQEFEAAQPRGECCILTAPYIPEVQNGEPQDWVREVNRRLALGTSPQEAMKETGKLFGVSKREVYQAILAEKEGK